MFPAATRAKWPAGAASKTKPSSSGGGKAQSQTQSNLKIADLESFYKAAKKRFDSDEEFKSRAKANVVKLQSGDPHCITGWKALCQASRQEFQKIYDRLDIELEEVGESFYNPMLAPMVDELIAANVAVESEGAICIFNPKINNKKNTVPLMVRKSDGGMCYGTTDMAALRYRANEVKADRVIYVTDAGQEET